MNTATTALDKIIQKAKAIRPIEAVLPSEKAWNISIKVLHVLALQNFLPKDFGPCVDEGVEIRYLETGRLVTLGFYNTEEMVYLTRVNKENSFAVDFKEEHLDFVLDEALSFLKDAAG